MKIEKEYLVDVPVAIVFFARPDTLKQVFEKVKQARPSKLLLIQDGPRKGRPDDIDNIEECRKIVEDINWNCEVHRNYSEVNLGCGTRSLTGFHWLFGIVDRAIILEDDCVADETFFPFCAELLEKYKDDDRINMISGFNHLGTYQQEQASYFFAKAGPSTGWATWRRNWKLIDEQLRCVDDSIIMNKMERSFRNKREGREMVKLWKRTRQKVLQGNRIGYWTAQWGIIKYLYNQITIISSVNMIQNIGVGANATYSGNSYKLLPRRLKKIFFMDIQSQVFPLKHRDYFFVEEKYDLKVFKIINPTRLRWFVEKVIFFIKKPFWR